MFINDPVAILEEAYKNLYGNNNYELRWDDALDEDDNKVAGYTFFPDDEGEPIIALDVDLQVRDVPETLAHEMAHVAAGVGAGHNEQWEKEFDRIHNEYDRICKERFYEFV